MSDTRQFAFQTVDVFANKRFGGNQLAVFPSAGGLSGDEMQKLAAEFNFSETTFVVPAERPDCHARIRIFNRKLELPFAGHPTIGTAFVLSRLSGAARYRFEMIAGTVEVLVTTDGQGQVQSASFEAPQRLSVLKEFDPEYVAAAIGLAVGDLDLSQHGPISASVGMDFVLVNVMAGPLSAASPDLTAFRALAKHHNHTEPRLSILLYSRSGSDVRARMFAPLTGTWEDPATGSANAALGAYLLSLSDEDTLHLDITQGVEMGRPSALTIKAERRSDGIWSRVRGSCISVTEGLAFV